MSTDDEHAELLGPLRAICMALPEVTERLSHGAPTWFVRGRKTFVTLWADGHHDDHFPHLWCAAPDGAQQALVAADPDRFFRPPYVGGRGWLGVRLDGETDWEEISGLCRDAYCVVAPKSLVAKLEADDDATDAWRTLAGFGADEINGEPGEIDKVVYGE